MNSRRPYAPPMVTGQEEFETRACGCAKVPGSGACNYCGPVWGAPHGKTRNSRHHGCYMNAPTVSRSS